MDPKIPIANMSDIDGLYCSICSSLWIHSGLFLSKQDIRLSKRQFTRRHINTDKGPFGIGY